MVHSVCTFVLVSNTIARADDAFVSSNSKHSSFELAGDNNSNNNINKRNKRNEMNGRKMRESIEKVLIEVQASAVCASGGSNRFFLRDECEDCTDVDDGWDGTRFADSSARALVCGVSWFPSITTTTKKNSTSKVLSPNGKNKKSKRSVNDDDDDDDDGTRFSLEAKWIEARDAFRANTSLAEKLGVVETQKERSRAKTADDLFLETNEHEKKKKKKKKNDDFDVDDDFDGDDFDDGVDERERRAREKTLQRNAAKNAARLIEEMKKDDVSAIDIVWVVPVNSVSSGEIVDFDLKDASKWPKNVLLAHGIIKIAKEKFKEKLRLKIVPVVAAQHALDASVTPEQKENSISSSSDESILHTRLESIGNIFGFKNTVVSSSLNKTIIGDASVLWRGKLIVGGFSSPSSTNNKLGNIDASAVGSNRRRYDRCIAYVEVSRECFQCAQPFMPESYNASNRIKKEMEENKNDIINKMDLVEHQKKKTTTNRIASAQKKKVSMATKKMTMMKNNNIKEEGTTTTNSHLKEETVLKINDVVLMSAIDAIDIDATTLPRHVSISAINSADWISGYASFCAKKFNEGVPGECPVLLCSLALAVPMHPKKGGGKVLEENKYRPVHSRDERVFCIAPVFSDSASVTFRCVKLIDAQRTLERRVLFPTNRISSLNGDEQPLCALPSNKRRSIEEEKTDDVLRTVAKMKKQKIMSKKNKIENENDDDEKYASLTKTKAEFENLETLINDYFAKRTRRRGASSDEDEAIREYCISWMKFLYLTKKDASVIANPLYLVFGVEEENELKRFYDTLEKSSKETADDIRHDVSLASVLHSTLSDCERKLESSETFARLLRSRQATPASNKNIINKRVIRSKLRQQQEQENGGLAGFPVLKSRGKAMKQKNKQLQLAAAAKTTSSDERKRKLAMIPKNTTSRYRGGSNLVAAAMSTDEASLEAWKIGKQQPAARNTTTANTTNNNNNGPTSFSGLGLGNSLSQQRPSESGAGSGATPGRRTFMQCPQCKVEFQLQSNTNFSPCCGVKLKK
jgi:hypothetical protein